jgi:ATP-binding cassette subfamily B protein
MEALRQSVFWGAIGRQKGWVWASVGFIVVGTALSLLMTASTAAIIDKGVDERTAPLGGLVGRFVALALVFAVLSFIGAQIRERIGYQLELDLRNLLYLRLQRADPRELDQYSTGQVVTRSLTDLALLEIFIRVVSGVVTLVPAFLGYTIYLIAINPVMWIVAFSSCVINGFLVNRIRKRLWGLSFLNLDQAARVTAAFDEPVRGIRVVKSFGREGDERGRVAKASAEAYRFALSRTRLEAKFDLVLRAVPVVIRSVLLLIGARFVLNGSLSAGNFLVMWTYTSVIVLIAQYIDEGVSSYQFLKTGAGRLTELLRKGGRATPRQAEPLPSEPEGLELHRVGVAFGAETAVSDVSLVVEAGTLTALTGPPASGKSTVATLAAGAIAPTEGQILLDGVEMGRLDPDDVRRAVHLVSEESFLFARSVRDNLAIGAAASTEAGDVVVDDALLLAALRAAAAEDVVEQLNGGLDEVLGDRGMTLSGGQRQRLALARALVVPPRVLVLDDALSAVSPALEVDILQRIRAHAPNTAILCISRRSGPMEIADRVVVLPERAEQRQLTTSAALSVDPSDTAAGLVAGGDATPYDARLLPILSSLKLTDDQPSLAADDAERDEPVQLRALMSAFKRSVGTTVGTLIALGVIGLVPEYIFGSVNDYIDKGNLAASDRLALGMIAVGLALGGFTFLFRIEKAKATQGMMFYLRRRMFARLGRLGIDFYDRETPGYVSTRVVADINQVERFLGIGVDPGAFDLLQHVARFVVTVGVILYLAPVVGVVVLVSGAVIGVVTAVQSPIADRAYLRRRLALGDVVNRFQEDHAGRYEIKAFGAERRARAEFGALARIHREAQKRAETVGNVFSESLELLRNLATAAVLLIAGNLALRGALTLGTVLTIRLYLREAIDRPIPALAKTWREWMRTRIALRQLNSLFDHPVLPVSAPGARECAELEGDIAFEGVSFGYPSTSRPVLHDVSFSIAAGDRLAIVGHTGAGKSSIAKLLTRVYDVDAGRILVDGIDIREYEPTSFRRRIGVVPQDAFLFKGTVASNIAYGRPDATRAEIEDAARMVGAWEVLVELPQGIDTPVEEEAHNLTAAERQLVALARSVLAGPDILVLDEATSHLDTDTERVVLDAILELGLTTVLVTHRLAAAERADVVVMLDEGKIIEAGSHRDLVAGSGSYPKLWGYALAAAPRRTRRSARRTPAPAPEAAVRAKTPAKPPAKANGTAKTTKQAAATKVSGGRAAKKVSVSGKAVAVKKTTARRTTTTGKG